MLVAPLSVFWTIWGLIKLSRVKGGGVVENMNEMVMFGFQKLNKMRGGVS
jgi:hypothetical protein